jgi:APA family basic amino acid/polyamine antiporter
MTNGLQRSMEFTDLMAFGLSAIMGSGGFNLIGKGIREGGSQFPLAIGSVALLFQGTSLVYQRAYDAFKANTSESDLVRAQFGDITANISSIAILLFNIISVSTIVVISSKQIFPTGSWSGQVGFAIALVASMTSFSLTGIDLNKEFVSVFGFMILALLGFATMIGFIEFGQQTVPLKMPSSISGTSPNIYKSILYFYFILAGFDALMKFAEETKDPDKNLTRSFYASNALATILTLGICFAFLVVFSTHAHSNKDNVISDIVESMLGKQAGVFTAGLSIVLMLVTSFVSFLATTRYMYSLGKEIPLLQSFSELNDNKVPWKSILIASVVACLAILNNNVFTLVKISDIALTLTLVLVSAAATKMQAVKGKMPLIEGATTVALVGLMGCILWCHD